MEIDINSQIIQMVQSRPVLYSKCNDFRGRSHQWKEIADILKVDVLWVKSRWHLLRAKFLMEYSSELKGKRSAFKYLNEMSFLVNHIDIKAFEMHSNQNDLRNQPEFVIVKKDLEDGSDDDSSNVFVELELDEGVQKEMIQISQTMDLTEEISDDELDETLYLSNGEFSQHRQLVKTPKYKLDTEPETFHLVEVREKEDSETVLVKESPKEKVEESIKTKTSSEQLEKPSSTQEEKAPDDLEVNVSCDVKSSKDRCEDTIFGELVTATLRRMPTERKKAVKREIMNILFT